MTSILNSDYIGVFIGLGFVIVATVFLPARVRWYVFSAGIAVVAFRAYQLYWAKGRLKELDNERDELRNELDGLRAQHAELEETHKKLAAELKQIKQERDELKQQREALDMRSANAEAEAEKLDEQLAKKNKEVEEQRQDVDTLVNFLESFAEAERQTANVPTNI
jgi:chromosome segregation ATPase